MICESDPYVVLAGHKNMEMEYSYITLNYSKILTSLFTFDLNTIISFCTIDFLRECVTFSRN